MLDLLTNQVELTLTFVLILITFILDFYQKRI